jgi:hypothetical protein
MKAQCRQSRRQDFLATRIIRRHGFAADQLIEQKYRGMGEFVFGIY